MVELDELDFDGSNLVASGFVTPLILDDDQDDDDDTSDSESEVGGPSGASLSATSAAKAADLDVVRRKLRLTSIFRYESEYTESNDMLEHSYFSYSNFLQSHLATYRIWLLQVKKSALVIRANRQKVPLESKSQEYVASGCAEQLGKQL
jgi:hypothetical protein